MMYNGYLAHYGILGMRWGIRRYQPYPKGYSGNGREIGNAKRVTTREKKAYDYKKSDVYKNASSGKKAMMTRTHDAYSKYLGQRASNKIDYGVYEEGKDRKKLARKEKTKQFLIGTSVLALSGSVPALLSMGREKINSMKLDVLMNNEAVGFIAKTEGLNTVKGRPTTGFRAYKNGKHFIEKILNAERRG